MIDAWTKTDAYRAVLRGFFAAQLQQSQAKGEDFVLAMYDMQDAVPSVAGMQALRESFARTVIALLDEGVPFNQVFSTRRFMMTTEMMAYYAYTDTSLMADDGSRSTRWYQDESSKAPTIRGVPAPASVASSGAPSDGAYLTFYDAGLKQSYRGMGDATKAATCAGVDPLVLTNLRTYNHAAEWGLNVWRFINGRGFGWIYPHDGADGAFFCNYGGTGTSAFAPSDSNDWRMVEIRAPSSGEYLTEFYDLKRLRQQNLLLMNSPRVGFFTTPAFLSQWGTNASNSSRAAADQTLIAALGEQVDGADTLPLSKPSAVDPQHAASAACFSCHQTLDPLRQFFRRDYSLSYSLQKDARQKQLPAAFSFRGQKVDGGGVVDLAQAIASHPKLALAWTVKLCSWANSSPCQANDPAVIAMAAQFAADNYDFRHLVRALFTSPLVTYAQTPATEGRSAQVSSVVRRDQLCQLLKVRLGDDGLCGALDALADGSDSLPARLAAMPQDGYTRGVNEAMYVSAPDPFYVGNLENICWLAAKQFVDGDKKWVSSADPVGASNKIAASLMALSPAEAAEPAKTLSDAFADLTAAGADPTVAMQSVFTAACSSVLVASVGQ